MSRARDLTGDTFGRLTVICKDEERTKTSLRSNYWLCRCSCGSPIKSIEGADLTRKRGTKSCGCLLREQLSQTKKKYNTYCLSGEYGIGYTSKGEEFYFDKEDYKRIKDYCWYLKDGYLVTCIYDDKNKKSTTIRLHSLVMNSKKGDKLDHINRDRADNRKENLRFISDRGNAVNISQRKDNISGKTGVYYHNRDKLWIANIMINGEQVEVARTTDKNDAILKRLEYEKIYYGKYSPNYQNDFKANENMI